MEKKKNGIEVEDGYKGDDQDEASKNCPTGGVGNVTATLFAVIFNSDTSKLLFSNKRRSLCAARSKHNSLK